jgi:Zn ribbon nucleic-acid-binding protein
MSPSWSAEGSPGGSSSEAVAPRWIGVSCDLCAAERRTPWYHEDEVCWVAECLICGTPMVVWRRHGPDPPPAERVHMLERLAEVATARLGADRFRVDAVMRRIPDHFHAHARDPAWWGFHPG